ncbi:hypothetical protein [Acidovorax sp. Q11]
MQSHHTLRTLRLWVLAWFVLALGVAVVAPLVSPPSMELVCSGTGNGAARLVIKTADGLAALKTSTLDCPLCLAADTPPTPPHTALPTAQAPAFAPHMGTPLLAQARVAFSPPARAPPFFN